jgi:DNA-damage-inducible protein D
MLVANGGEPVQNHFVNVNKMIQIGSNTMRQVRDIKLSRFACYIISQNGNPAKNEIALAQDYFAQQTRRQELSVLNSKEIVRVGARHKLTAFDKKLSSTVLGRGVDGHGLAVIKSRGDEQLFGGQTTQGMKAKYGIKDRRKPLADYLPIISLTAKQLANEMTTLILQLKICTVLTP